MQEITGIWNSLWNSALNSTFSALKHRNFRLFWFGQLISVSGTWMQTVGQGWLVLQLTNSPFLLGLVTSLNWLPVMLFSLFGGVFADRLPKRKVLIVTQSLAMLQAFVLAVLTWTGLVTVNHILLLAFFLGVVQAVDSPTRQAFIVEMVGKPELLNAIALNSSAFNGGRILGPSLGGVIMEIAGVGSLFFINGLSFLAVIAGLILMDPAALYSPSKTDDSGNNGLGSPKDFASGNGLPTGNSILGHLREGLDYVYRSPQVLVIIIMVGIASIFAINYSTLMPIFARDVLNVGPSGLGFLMSSIGAGALAGGMTLATRSKRAPAWGHLLSAALIFATVQFLFSISRWYWASLVFLFLTGFFQITFTASANTMIQLRVPDDLRGRVMSLYFLVFAGLTPIGSLYAGAVANVWGAPAANGIGTAFTGIFALGTMLWLKKQRLPDTSPR